MRERGEAPFFTIMIAMSAIIAVVLVFVYVTDPMWEIFGIVENHMDNYEGIPRDPISNTKTIWPIAIISTVVIVVIAAVAKMLRTEPESEWRRFG